MVRVSSGILKGLTLKTPKHGDVVRPSHVRLRQSVFNVLRNFTSFGELSADHSTLSDQHSSWLAGTTVIDLFSGTGAIGIEAMSHGASKIVFVDSSKVALSVLQENLRRVESALRSQFSQSQSLQFPLVSVIPLSIEKAYHRLPKANIIFADPPYCKGFFKIISDLENKENKLKPGGILIFEEASSETLGESLESSNLKSLELINTKEYGESSVYFFKKLPI